MTGGALPSDRHITYQQRMKLCYRPTCARCRSGIPSHGPYWYASWREGGRVRSRYLGKQAPREEPSAIGSGTSEAAQRAQLAQQPPLRIQTLGGLVVWHGSERVAEKCWSRKKATTLLGIILSQPDLRMHREELLELLWPDIDMDVAQTRFWSTLRQLRQILDVPEAPGSHLRWSGDHLLLSLDVNSEAATTRLDATDFERLADIALAGRDVQACRRAVERYGNAGDYLPQFMYDDWASRRREYLRRRLIGVLLQGATLLQGEGAPDEAERYLDRILILDPANEPAACALMTLLRAQGRSVDGLRVYRKLELELAQLGVQPESETRGIRDQLEDALQLPPASDILPAQPDNVALTNLPRHASDFIGRRQEHRAVVALLKTSRLVTLTGMGGVGKTRLAEVAGAAQVPAYRDGVWLVELAALPVGATSTEVLVAQTLARTLGVGEKVGEPLIQTIAAFLHSREILIVLDNCEHLVQQCAELVHTLLMRCPDVTVLATSREPLNVVGESVWVVPPLTVPRDDHGSIDEVAQSEAVQLFVSRAKAKQPTFVLSASNANAIAQICRKVEGIPLSLELAAARIAMLSVEQISARLDDRLRLLTGGSRTALPRHHSLRATLHWSYTLLNELERILLRRLSVFAGGCALNSIEAVCAGDGIERENILDAMGSLVNKSLVLTEPSDRQVRYRLSEMVRQYGQEHLATWEEEEAIRERHCAWYITLAEQARADLRGPEQLRWLNQLDQEHDNIRTALEWSIGRLDRRDYGLRLAGAIWPFWHMRNYQTEGRNWLERVLHDSKELAGVAAARAEALSGAGGLAYMQSDYKRAAVLLEESCRCARSAGDSAIEARALMYLAHIAGQMGNNAQALAKYRKSLRLLRELRDVSSAANVLYNIGVTLLYLQRYAEAHRALDESLQIWRSIEYNLGISMALKNLACIARRQGAIAHAKMVIEESLSFLLASGAQNFKGEILLEMGAIAHDQSSFAEAIDYFREALRHALELQDEPARWEAIEGVARVSAAAGAAVIHHATGQDPTQQICKPFAARSSPDWPALMYAATLLANTNEQTERPRDTWQIAQHDECLRSLRAVLGEDVFAQCWMDGQRLTQEAACRLALDGPQVNRDLQSARAPVT